MSDEHRDSANLLRESAITRGNIQIYTLGSFAITVDGKPLRFTGKVPRRPLLLLKAIIAFGDQNIPEANLADTLWPDVEGDTARFSLTSTVYRLRLLLGYKNVLIRRDGLISLDARNCWVDLWALEVALDAIESIFQKSPQPLSEEQIDLIGAAIKLYRGSFLQGDHDTPWAKPIADRLRRRVLNCLMQISRHWERLEQIEKAVAYFEKAFAVDPCAEDVCRSLMSTYHHLSRPAEVLNIYEQCGAALKSRAGLSVSAQTDALLKEFLGK